MRTANLDDRLVILDGDRAIDVAEVSDGLFAADPGAVFARWQEFCGWAGSAALPTGKPLDPDLLRAPSPRPPQVFGIGLNYRDHAAEAVLEIPAEPMVFSKFPSSVTGPQATVQLSGNRCDFEAELCVVIGPGGHRIAVEEAWSAIAGLTIGQDLSDRRMQFRDKPPQFSLAKSFPGYSPTGPWLVSPDALADPDRLAIRCEIDGELMQDGTTADLIFTVPELVAKLSSVVTLLPGDLIFTGTPAGVGAVRRPPRYLRPGQVITTSVSGLGSMRTVLV